MRLWRSKLTGIFLLPLILLPAACVSPPLQRSAANYYLISEITYLRDAPGYKGYVIGQLYQGDQVERLYSNDPTWWRVRSVRTDQTGWVQGELFGLKPAPITYYYVQLATVDLRECPKDECPSLQLLFRGDRVQKIEQNSQGWWHVLVAKSRSLGWLPPAAVAEKLEPPREGKTETPYYYVAVKSMKLQGQPSPGSEVVKTLRFNDQLKKLEANPAGWVKVRQPATGAVGWVRGEDLEAFPARYPRREPSKKLLEPEAM